MRMPFFDMNRARWRLLGEQVISILSVVFLMCLIVIPVIWFIWFVFFTDTFTVQAITVVDARPHTSEQVQQILAERIGANMFWLQTGLLEQKLLLSIPQIRDVHMVRTLPSTLKVVIQEKEPVLLLLSQRKYYFVDGQGIAYEEARLDTLPGVVLPVVKNNDENATLAVGTPVLTESFISFVQSVQRHLPDMVAAQVVEVRIPSLAAREVHFHLANNWQLRFDVTRGASGQLTILRTLLQTTIPPEKQPLIEYIDLRIPQRVYYKLKEPLEKISP